MYLCSAASRLYEEARGNFYTIICLAGFCRHKLKNMKKRIIEQLAAGAILVIGAFIMIHIIQFLTKLIKFIGI